MGRFLLLLAIVGCGMLVAVLDGAEQPQGPEATVVSHGSDSGNSTTLDHGHEPAASGKVAEAQSGSRILVVLLMQCGVIVVASLFGGWLPQLLHLTHTRMQVMISFVGGLMLGISLLHLLPHSVAEVGSLDHAVLWVVCGTLATFFLLRIFHFHQHEPSEHTHAHSAHELSWTGVALGLSLHTLIDGVALGASVRADAVHGQPLWMLGLGTFLAIALHKPLDALSITSLMAAGGWSWRLRQFVNLGYALMCPAGAVLFVVGIQKMSAIEHVVVGSALAFAAGVFLCISMSDLLPELEFHTHDRLKLSAAILSGIILAYGIRFLEPEHAHGATRAHVHVWPHATAFQHIVSSPTLITGTSQPIAEQVVEPGENDAAEESIDKTPRQAEQAADWTEVVSNIDATDPGRVAGHAFKQNDPPCQ